MLFLTRVVQYAIHTHYYESWFFLLQIIPTTSYFQKIQGDVNQASHLTSLKMNHQENPTPIHKKQKILIRDQNLKDNIMAVQRRIPRRVDQPSTNKVISYLDYFGFVLQVVEEDIFGSVTVQGSKKQNLNHLLNFHYQPRDVQRNSNTWGHRKSTSNHWLLSIQRHKYNKEQFLQARLLLIFMRLLKHKYIFLC